MRASLLLRSVHPGTGAPAPALSYALGLSYAAKQSPPFVPPSYAPPSAGFAGAKTPLGRWVDLMRSLPAGRGELRESQSESRDSEAGSESDADSDGGWGLDTAWRVRRWGAGEDFFAVVDGGAFTHVALSDGVGGWAPDYDPALYSQALMYHYAKAAQAQPSIAPWAALRKAYAAVEADAHVEAGSATACAWNLAEDGSARGVNLGDSGFSVIRRDASAFHSTPQTHYFNCPLQLSKIPPKLRGQGVIMDKPEQGEKFEVKLGAGDVMILYSDGLSDNLPMEHVTQLHGAIGDLLRSEANAHLTAEERAHEHARLLADVLVAAGRNAMTRTGKEEGGKGWKTPFELEARKNGNNWPGGKIDDVCVLVAVASNKL